MKDQASPSSRVLDQYRHDLDHWRLRRYRRPDQHAPALRRGREDRHGQAHVKRWIDDLMPLLCGDGDPLGVEDLCTHRMPLEKAPHGYEILQKKEDGAIKVVLQP